MNGKELIIKIGDKEIAHCDPINIPASEDKDWGSIFDHAKEWTIEGGITLECPDLYEYYYRRGERLYFRNCFGDRIDFEWPDEHREGIEIRLTRGELYKLLMK